MPICPKCGEAAGYIDYPERDLYHFRDLEWKVWPSKELPWGISQAKKGSKPCSECTRKKGKD